MNTWDSLSMAQRAEVMKLAVQNGIYSLDTIRGAYNEYAKGGDTKQDDYYATMEKVAEENYKKWGFNNPDEALVHALNDNTYDYRGYYQKYPQSRANADTHWTDEFKAVYHPTFSNESRYSGQKSIYNPLGLPGGFWVGETFVPRAWQVVEANKFAEGGGIHIKPENRGKFTALKERTGHSATWFKEHGTPAQKKMATFALNARKWKHGDGGFLDVNDNMFLTGGPKRSRMPAHPKNRDKDPEAYDAYKEWERQQQLRRKEQEEQDKIYAEERDRKNAKAAEELNRHKDTVMSALSDIANSIPFTGSEVAEAVEAQRQDRLDKWHGIKRGMDASMTAAELMAAGYGVVRGVTHFNRMLARNATQSTGQAVSREAMQNLLKWNNRVNKVDKAQVAMNTLGGTADAYQWATADNSFDAWENGLETGANAAGVVGGMNWFRDLPYLRRIGGDKIDAVLDGLGYGAAAWDVVKNLPPLSGALEGIREQSAEQKSYGGLLERAMESAERDRQYAHGGEMGNYYDGWGGLINTLKKGVQSARQKVKDWGLDKSPGQHLLEWLTVGNDAPQTDTRQESLQYRNRPAERRGIVDASGKRTIQVVPKRERENNSPTKSQSTKLENSMRTLVMQQQNVAGGSDPKFDIPFIPEKAIIINGSTTSTNVLDSLAKYAGIHNRNPQLSQHPIHERSYYTKNGLPHTLNMNEIIGLSTRETKNGAQPYFNQNGTPEYNREVGNSNYFTAFGYIPADNLMRNFQYNNADVDRTTPPILDAFQYYAQGDYNAKREKHKKSVNEEGKAAWQNPKVREWWELSGKYWYNNPNGPE